MTEQRIREALDRADEVPSGVYWPSDSEIEPGDPVNVFDDDRAVLAAAYRVEKRRADCFMAVLEGQEYERIDELPDMGIEFARRLGESARGRTVGILSRADVANALAEEYRECRDLVQGDLEKAEARIKELEAEAQDDYGKAKQFFGEAEQLRRTVGNLEAALAAEKDAREKDAYVSSRTESDLREALVAAHEELHEEGYCPENAYAICRYKKALSPSSSAKKAGE